MIGKYSMIQTQKLDFLKMVVWETQRTQGLCVDSGVPNTDYRVLF